MTKEQEKETIKYLEFLQKEYLEDAKRRKENGEITGYGTMEDIDKLRALHIGFALDMLKENSAEIEQKNTELAEKTAEIERLNRQINLMAKAMDKIQDPQVCKYCDNKINLNHGYCTDAGKCKKGIKQYFERKSEE